MTTPLTQALASDSSLKLAIAHHQAGRFKEAVEGYKAVLQVAPQHPAANYNLGLLALQSGEAAAGLPYLLAALEAEADRGQYWISYIDALFQAGQPDEALQVLELARRQGLQGEEVEALAQRLGAEPREVAGSALKNRGARPDPLEIDALVSEFGAGRYAEAAATAQRMTEQYPQHEFGWKALGAAYKQLGRTEDALAAMQKAAALSPGDVEAHYNLGVTQQALDRLMEAAGSYREALRLSPDYADAHSNLGVVLQTLGRLDEAAASYRQALQIRPDYVEALGNLGKVLRALGQKEDAIACFRALLKIRPDDVEGHYNLGVLLGESGQAEAAVASFRRALHLAPDYADAHFALGHALEAVRDVAGAEASYASVLQINPDYAEALFTRANHLMSLDQPAEAETLYRRVIRLTPAHAAAHGNLGVVLAARGQTSDAEASYRRALQINPAYAKGYSNLGVLLREQGRLEDACDCFRQALQQDENYADAYNNLGLALHDLGEFKQAEQYFRRALQIDPVNAQVYNNLGNTCTELKRKKEAEACYREALRINADFVQAHANLGITLICSNRLAEAVASLMRALELDPVYADAHGNMGLAFHTLGRLEEGVACFRRVAEIKPDSAEAHNNLGNYLRDFGALDDAVQSYRRALELDPGYAMAHSNLIFTLDLAKDVSIPAMQAERRVWEAMHAARFLPHPPHANDADAQRRLRIGYVSADFRSYSAPAVFAAMLFNFDRSRFDVYCYNNESEVTALTRRLQRSVTGWRVIHRQSDEDVVELIRRDQIDILVDLSGHSRENRLPVFARKPAPIQITAWAYSTGTGMRAMDVLFSDPILIPPDERALYAEEIRYLPNFLSYYPFQTPPAVTPLPALTKKYVTFATFSRLEKVSDDAYRTWAAVLLAVPGSRMLFKNREMDHAAGRARVTDYFTRAGVAPERLILLGGTPWEQHMAAFDQVDIALDPFPQGGGVTSLEGFLMGVPVITLRWPTFGGRTGASILTTLGLTDWIAETPQQYVDIAQQKAADLHALAELRQQMRERLMTSILCDADAYARVVEQEYRQLWQEWCAASNDHGKKATPDNETCHDRSLTPVSPLPEGEEYGSSLRVFHVKGSDI